MAAGKKKNTGGRTKASGDPPLEPLALKPLLETARVGEILDGYKCDSCSQAGTTHRQDLIFLLPQVYIVHINRAGIGGEIGGDHGDIRHGNPVSFPDSLNLKDCGLLLAPDTPLDWNLEPCSVEFDLFGACFHRGKAPMQFSAQTALSVAHPTCPLLLLNYTLLVLHRHVGTLWALRSLHEAQGDR